MKGGIAAMIAAVEAIQRAGIRLQGDVFLESVVDEETGGPGTTQTIEHGYRADAAIVVEPTDFAIHPVEGGLEWLRVVVRGRSGHSAYRYRSVHAGGQGAAVNAIEKTAKILAAVQELERHWAVHKRHPLLPAGITTINPGVMIGGTGGGQDGVPNVLTAVSTFPDYCALELSLKYLPSEETATVRAEFEDYIARVAAADPWLREHPPEIEWGIRGVSFPPAETPADHPFLAVLSEAAETGDRGAGRDRGHGRRDGPGLARAAPASPAPSSARARWPATPMATTSSSRSRSSRRGVCAGAGHRWLVRSGGRCLIRDEGVGMNQSRPTWT